MAGGATSMSIGNARFGILGCGRIAHMHAIQMQRLGKLAAVCDVDRGKAEKFAQEWGATAYYHLEDMIERNRDLDLVSVCTPNGLHSKHSVVILKNHIHVLCEKPMALTVGDCEAMLSAAYQSGSKLFIVKQNRFNPPVVAVKSLLQSGDLGAIYSAQVNCFWNRDASYYKNSWKGSVELDGGTLFTQFSHFVDLLYWFLGDVDQIQAVTRNYAHKGIIEFEDTGSAILTMKSGTIVSLNFTVNSYNKNMEGSLTLFGEKGTVKIGGEYLNELEYQQIQGLPPIVLDKGAFANNYGAYRGSMSNHDKVFENILGVLKGEMEPIATSTDALKTVEIINKIYSASRGLQLS